MEFTDLLDEYLKAKSELDEAKVRFTGYDFSYFHAFEVDRYQNTKNALNEAFRAQET